MAGSAHYARKHGKRGVQIRALLIAAICAAFSIRMVAGFMAPVQPSVLSALIRGGTPAEQDRYPYLASLRNPETLAHFCAGALIAPAVVLTAAHCVDPVEDGIFSPLVYMGHDCDDCEFGLETAETVKTIFHHRWTGDFRDGADLAVLILKRPLSMPLLRVFPQPPAYALWDYRWLTIMGWGVDHTAGRIATSLNHAEVPYRKNAACSRLYENAGEGKDVIKADMMCAGGLNARTCQGDPGGPLIIKGDSYETDIGIGITSFGTDGCKITNLPAGFIRLSVYQTDLALIVPQQQVEQPWSDPADGTSAANVPTSVPTTPSPTPAPTSAPTTAPTSAPTPSPTPAPTPSPTQAPTPSPTPAPTPSPTPAPTPSPTPAPTPSPTPAPTPSPTRAPTPSPTPAPTQAPTPSPTRAPTPSPTLSPTKQDRYPYLASLRNPETLAHFCAGALIAPAVVLTAAHCVDPQEDGIFSPLVYMGYDCDDCEFGLETAETVETVIHPLWAGNTLDGGDLALLILDRAMSKPLLRVLPQPPPRAQRDYRFLTVLWWGVDKTGFATSLNHAEAPYRNNTACSRLYENAGNGEDIIKADMMCVGGSRARTCQGESGGPLIMEGNSYETDIGIGILSFGSTGCGNSSLPAVFTRLSLYQTDLALVVPVQE